MLYSNLLLIGAKLDLDEIPAEILQQVIYFSMKRRAKEEEEKFKALFDGLQKIMRFK